VTQVGVAQAAHMLGLSQDTVRRRLRSGEMAGQKVAHAGGFRWLVDVPEGTHEEIPQHEVRESVNGQGETAALRELVDALREQLDSRTREISELHQLLAARALPSPGNSPWWMFWR